MPPSLLPTPLLLALLVLGEADASLALFPAKVPLPRSGLTLSLYGDGPPVLFCPGLFGTVPHWIYSDFLGEVADRNVTVVVARGWGGALAPPLSARTMDEVADALAVDAVALVAHSSVRREVLESPRLRRAVLCDPVVVPELDGLRLAGPRVRSGTPFLVVRAGRAHGDDDAYGPGIPDYLSPRLDQSEVVTFERMGHADLLDDAWAEAGTRLFPWMRAGAARPRQRPFADWTRGGGKEEGEGGGGGWWRVGGGGAGAPALRRAYRRDVASRAVRHVLLQQPAADDLLEQVEQAAADRVPAADDGEQRVEVRPAE